MLRSSSCRLVGHGHLFLQKNLFMAEEKVTFRESLGSPEGGAAAQEKEEEEHPGETEAREPEEGEQVQEEVLPDRQEGAGASQNVLPGGEGEERVPGTKPTQRREKQGGAGSTGRKENRETREQTTENHLEDQIKQSSHPERRSRPLMMLPSVTEHRKLKTPNFVPAHVSGPRQRR